MKLCSAQNYQNSISSRIRRRNTTNDNPTKPKVEKINNLSAKADLTEDEVIMNYATMSRSCNRRFLIEYLYEFRCLNMQN